MAVAASDPLPTRRRGAGHRAPGGQPRRHRRRRGEERLGYLALHDELTGLANRRMVREHLASILGAESSGGGVVGLVCDLDNFKKINDSPRSSQRGQPPGGHGSSPKAGHQVERPRSPAPVGRVRRGPRCLPG